MAASTGPDINTYSIPELNLGDTFNTWRDLTNTAIYKLNKIKWYEGVSSGSISVTTSAGGTASMRLAETVTTGVTFAAPVVFNSDVVFNNNMVTMNTNILTIDDYNIIIGDTSGANDASIGTAGGGGIILNRTSGASAEWLWQPTIIQGTTGVWRANSHIGFSGSTSGLYPYSGGVLPIHGTGIRMDGGLTSEHGYSITMTSDGVSGITSERKLQFSRFSPAGATVFMEVLSGLTYGNQPSVSIYNGVNKKIVNQSHTFSFGQPVYLNGGQYALAIANSVGTSEVVGLVSRVIDSNNFEITFIGEIFGNFGSATEDGSTTLSAGSVYYLSPFSAGRISPSLPIAAGQVHKAVLIATGTNSAIVYPFTGGLLSQPTNITSSTSMGTNIQQLNQFSTGDFVRWKAGSTTLTYGATTGTYPLGVYVKSQANSDVESELAGMVIKTGTIVGTYGGSSIYSGFDLLMDGFFGGICLPSNYGPISNGTVYFLKRDAVGSSNCLESSTPCFASNYPVVSGSIRKPLFMATNNDLGNFSGYLFSYRGDSVDPSGLSASISLDSLLVQNLGSCGAVQDLRFGVRDGSGVAGGKQVMRLSSARPGSVDIGWSGIGDAGATLDVKGPIRAGSGLSVQGSDIIVGRYNTDVYPETLNVFGTQYSSGNSVISHGIRPAGVVGNVQRYTSTSGFPTIPRTALEVGTIYGYAGLMLRTSTSSFNWNTGTEVPMQDTFWVNTNQAVYNGGNVGISTVVPATKLHITTSTANDGIFISGASNTLRIATNNGAGAFNSITQAGDRAIIFGGGGRDSETAGFVIAPWRSDLSGLRVDSSGNVAIGTANNSAKLAIGLTTAGIPIYLYTGGANIPSYIRWDDNTGSRSYIGHGSSDDSLHLCTYRAAPLQFWTSNTERMRIDSAGLVGIGTQSPSAKLHVSLSGTNSEAIRMEGTDVNAPLISFYRSGNRKAYIQAPDYALALVAEDTSGVMQFWTAGSQRMTINNLGSVGIGTNTPPYKFTVAGSLASTPMAVIGDGGVTACMGYIGAGSDVAYTGTLSNHPYALISNNTNRLNISAAGDVSIFNTTASTGTNSGALVVRGGVGVAGALNVGGALAVTGTATAATPTTTAHLTTKGYVDTLIAGFLPLLKTTAGVGQVVVVGTITSATLMTVISGQTWIVIKIHGATASTGSSNAVASSSVEVVTTAGAYTISPVQNATVVGIAIRVG